ncbi:DUF389 domain-containing protein [Pinirhizobacter soli]|uniref:DUF389 domain-containing protein n=1 Tax=Pinirhizobacter soli TaxID=2786953 RepID=UPI00202A5D51|nr:DUF389 domain-containing protein [Pinirhizobacter soli]
MFASPYRAWRRLNAKLDHPGIGQAIDDDGRLAASYLFMCAMAAGIAMIGLLSNSASVIIGAMLVSPLMGPIVRLGLGIGTLSLTRVWRSLGTLACGMAVALAVSVTIVWVSPLQVATPEILARTNPNIFDMVAATLSGLAGGYAMIRNRGGTIVGVAIATALMPPMAVVGFGLATGQFAFAQGALLLFTTNLAAIALSVTLVCTFYGFGGASTRKAVAWQLVVGMLVLLPLALPLSHALTDIARQTRTVNTVRSAMSTALGSQQMRILDLKLDNAGATPVLDVTFAVQAFTREDDDRLRKALVPALAAGTVMRFQPVIVADPSGTEGSRSSLGSAVIGTAVAGTALAEDPTAADIVRHFPLPLLDSHVDAAKRRVELVVSPSARASLATLRQMEATLTDGTPGWQVAIIPPPRPLPPVLFTRGSADLGVAQTSTLEDLAWAMRHWESRGVLLEGRASSDGHGPVNLAQARAEAVRSWLEQQGFVVTLGASYPLPDQQQREDAEGVDAFRSVFVHVTDAQPLDAPPHDP